MLVCFRLLVSFALGSCLATAVQAQTDDGFLRRNGATYVLRHGQPRPMTREVHLPNGRTVTPEGFVLHPDGHRTALREGQGCTLRGTAVSSRQLADGRWVLATTAAPAPPAGGPGRRVPPGQLRNWWKHLGKKHGKKHGH